MPKSRIEVGYEPDEALLAELLEVAEEMIADCLGGSDPEQRLGTDRVANLTVAAILGVLQRRQIAGSPEFWQTMRRFCRQRLEYRGQSFSPVVEAVFSDYGGECRGPEKE